MYVYMMYSYIYLSIYLSIYLYIYICVYIYIYNIYVYIFHLVSCSIVTFVILCHNVCSPMVIMTKILTCIIDLFLLYDL